MQPFIVVYEYIILSINDSIVIEPWPVSMTYLIALGIIKLGENLCV